MPMMQTLQVSVAKWYLSLFPVKLESYKTDRQPFQRAEMEYSDECGPEGFHSYFPNLSLQGKRLLDYGCGYGGRTVRFAELGANTSGTEIVPEMIDEARKFAEKKNISVDLRLVDDKRLPFDDNSFDVVFSYDVFEHVRDLEASMRECLRVLRPGGTLYALFPPFYNPFGGSHLHVFVSNSPAPNILFSCPVLVQAVQELLTERRQTYIPAPVDPPDYPLWGMNGTSIRRFESILSRLPKSGVVVKYLQFITPYRRKWKAWRMKYWTWPSRVATHIPLLREAFIERIQLELTK